MGGALVLANSEIAADGVEITRKLQITQVGFGCDLSGWVGSVCISCVSELGLWKDGAPSGGR